MSDIISIFASLGACVALGVGGFILAPKGTDQLVWRTAIILSLSCMWLMWVLTYMAQMNPLIQPLRHKREAH